MLDVSYEGENDFNRAIEVVEILASVKFIQGKELMGNHFYFLRK